MPLNCFKTMEDITHEMYERDNSEDRPELMSREVESVCSNSSATYSLELSLLTGKNLISRDSNGKSIIDFIVA